MQRATAKKKITNRRYIGTAKPLSRDMPLPNAAWENAISTAVV